MFRSVWIPSNRFWVIVNLKGISFSTMLQYVSICLLHHWFNCLHYFTILVKTLGYLLEVHSKWITPIWSVKLFDEHSATPLHYAIIVQLLSCITAIHQLDISDFYAMLINIDQINIFLDTIIADATLSPWFQPVWVSLSSYFMQTSTYRYNLFDYVSPK